MDYCFNRVIRKSMVIKDKSYIIDNTLFIYLSHFAIKADNKTNNVDIVSSEFKRINSDDGCVLVDSEKINIKRVAFGDVLLSNSFAILHSSVNRSCISQNLVSFTGSKGFKMIQAQNGNHFINMLNVSNCNGTFDTCFYIKTQSNSSVGYCHIVSNYASTHVTVTFLGSQNYFAESVLVNNTQDGNSYGTISCYQKSSVIQCYRISIISNSGNFLLMGGEGQFIVMCCYISDTNRIQNGIKLSSPLDSPIPEVIIDPGVFIIQQKSQENHQILFLILSISSILFE